MPEQIGKYRILRTLGQGAMGEVYLAHHPAIGRDVAIKTILPSAAKGEEAEGRFRREAEAAGHLNHPNLVTVFDFDKDQGVLFLVMEYVKGDDLEDLLRDRALAPAQFLEVLAQVCDGLAHAHRNGIIHRDIKPANIRVVREGGELLAKVMDFGIARMGDSSLTSTGIVMGTVSYMAPEYIREGRATSQSDLFAVGVMLYEGLTGRKPFPGETTTTILFKIVSDPPEPVSPEAIRGISPSIRGVLDRALAKDPAARFPSAEALARALRACKDPTWSGVAEEGTTMLARPGGAPAGTGSLPAGSGAALPGVAVPAAAGPTLSERPTAVAATAGLPSGVAPGARTDLPSGVGPARTGRLVRAWLLGLGAVTVLLVAGGLAVRHLARSQSPVAEPSVRPGAPSAPAPSPVPAAEPAPAPAPSPVPAAEPAPAPAAVARPAPAAPATASKPTPTAGLKPAPAAVLAGAKPAPPRPAPPGPAAAGAAAPAKPAEPADGPAPAAEDPVKTIGRLLGSDPRQAAAMLKPMVQAQPGSVELQGQLLAALYRSGQASEFDRALARATAAGVTVKSMLGIPAFRAAMADESRLQKARTGVLPLDVMAKVLEGL
jgi:serine/threonine-protein kinase